MFDELNRRKAVVYVHPIVPEACKDICRRRRERAGVSVRHRARHHQPALQRGAGALAGSSLHLSAFRRRDAAARRARGADGGPRPQGDAEAGEATAMAEMKNLYFDVASSANPITLAGILHLVPATQLMFGTDYPFSTSIPYTVDPLRESGLGAADLAAIESGTALAGCCRASPKRRRDRCPPSGRGSDGMIGA